LGNLSDGVFLSALLRSPTFWGSAGVWAVWGLGCAAALGLLLFGLARRVRRRGLLADECGTAAAVDFTLTFPVLWFFTACVVQFTFLANGAVIVHYAAYTAARSARVYSFEYDNDVVDHEKLIGYPYVRSSSLRDRVEGAARFALIAASTSNTTYSSPPLPRPVIRAIVSAAGDPAREGPLMRKAAYAFDPSNSKIEYSLPDPTGATCGIPPGLGLDTTAPNACNPVTATVEFRLPVTIPGGQMIADECEGGVCYKMTRATVSLI